jgi:hypothetical protein
MSVSKTPRRLKVTKTKNPTRESSGDVPAVMAAMMTVNPVLARAWTDIMSESARFLTDRLRRDLEAQKALMACKTPAELIQVQAEFMRTAVKQYADEAARICEMTMRASHDGGDDLKSGNKRGYDDIPV